MGPEAGMLDGGRRKEGAGCGGQGGSHDHRKSWYGFTHVILTTLMGGKYSCYFHITGETEAPGGGITCSHSYSQ